MTPTMRIGSRPAWSSRQSAIGNRDYGQPRCLPTTPACGVDGHRAIAPDSRSRGSTDRSSNLAGANRDTGGLVNPDFNCYNLGCAGMPRRLMLTLI